MKSFVLDYWDAGHVTINCDFAALFRQAGLTDFASIWATTTGAEAAKNLRADRVTLRFTLLDAEGREHAFYIKRHQGAPWKEYVKPLLQMSWPSVGARPEWEALLAFHDVGLATMTPVALGETRSASFLITAAIDGCEKLSELRSSTDTQERREIAVEVADIARKMHQSRLHHQDFYLGHLLRPTDGGPIHVIDLGRVQRHQPWTASRWIVKDLAQLNYSARKVSRTERLRFLERYLNRPLTPADRPFIQRILRKTARIARHSRKNRL